MRCWRQAFRRSFGNARNVVGLSGRDVGANFFGPAGELILGAGELVLPLLLVGNFIENDCRHRVLFCAG